jgi:tetratricopeptide (TPR) repeat protein
MRNALITVLALFFVFMLFAAATVIAKNSSLKIDYKRRDVIGCAPTSFDEIIADENGKFISVLPGWGKYSYAVSTSNDSAQFYFNQGLNLYYSFHLKQALASFKEAARFDKTCVMAYWGQALSMGPYYNGPSYKMSKQVPAVVKIMSSYTSNANDKEKKLIYAMQQRYSEDTTNADRLQLDKNYASAMASLIKVYPEDNDIKALYIDAVMLQHKWDFWNNKGKPKDWTPELVTFCEQIIKKEPLHPGALHYYIHVTEASKHPEVALKSANVLKDVMPGTAHMVHMASHMYQRNGQFAAGVYVNEDANAASNFVDSLLPSIGDGQNTIIHYFAVQSYCAMNAGMYEKAMPVYLRARNRVVELNGPLENLTYMQFVYMMPVMAAVRLGKWEHILASAPVDRKWKYAAILEDFAKGMAYVRSKNYKAAAVSLFRIDSNIRDSLLGVRRWVFNKPVQSCRIAADILRGELLQAQGKTYEAIAAFKRAIEEEDKLIYSEPQDWLIPSRQYLGNLFLKLNRIKEAEQVYHEDLAWHPGNGWSLLGLQKCLLAQNKKKEAANYKAAFQKAFREADAIPVASVF